MENQTFILINQKIDGVDNKVDVLRGDLKEIHGDVKDLLKFKWQIVGGTVVVSLVITLIFQVGSLLMKL